MGILNIIDAPSKWSKETSFSRFFDKVALRTRKRAFEKYKRNFVVTLDRVIFLPLNLPFFYQRVVYKG